MAVVRFSDELKSSIITNAKDLFRKRIEAQDSAVPDIGNELMALVYAPLIPQLSAIPREFLTWRDTMELSRIGTTNYARSFHLSKMWPLPDKQVLVDGATIRGSYMISITLDDNEKFAPFKRQLDEWRANVDAIVAQRDDFVAGVRKVIEAHSTLAPALKAWPPLWDLVPEAYKERHRKVVERSRPDTQSIDVDLTKLTATVAVSKLTK